MQEESEHSSLNPHKAGLINLAFNHDTPSHKAMQDFPMREQMLGDATDTILGWTLCES